MNKHNVTSKPGLLAGDFCSPDTRLRSLPEGHDGIWMMSDSHKPGGEEQRLSVYGVWMEDPGAQPWVAKHPRCQLSSGGLIRRRTSTRQGPE